MNHLFIFPTENNFYLLHRYKALLLNLATKKMVSLVAVMSQPLGQWVEVDAAAFGKLSLFPLFSSVSAMLSC